ncbi:MAG: cytochrome b/b6 domain-containing protein [Nitrospiraceae bacterium]|nr:cytochrome b/b6 domain-containing protein [Nitrospiraceae bacterium]
MGTAKSFSVRRFSYRRIIEHWLYAAVFMALVITGLAQKFYFLDASKRLIMGLGGIDSVRLIHRLAGVLLIYLTAQNILAGLCGVMLKKWKPNMIIRKKDFTDAVEDLRYYFGATEAPASCGRYSYKQKFEYWGILTGAVLMMATGLVLWFPAFAASYLPGEVIPAAKALHSNHALLIFLIISVWHIYNSIFSPEVFPLDTSMITGYISRKRMVEEHPLELAEMEGAGESVHAGKNVPPFNPGSDETGMKTS